MLDLERNNIPDLRTVGLHPDFWYPLARSKDVKPGKMKGVTFAGEPIVIVRTQSNRVFALEDRCAHRQFPLHMGVVEGDTVKCGYHAWCYRFDGEVARVPYLPKGAKKPCGVRNYPCREAYGLIFVFPGSAEKADQVPFPQCPMWSSADVKTMYFSRQVKCHYSFMHENLMDMNHQFLHRRLMGTMKPVLLKEESGNNWVEVQYNFSRVAGKRKMGGTLMLGLQDEHENDRDYELMVVRTEYPYQRLQVYRPHKNNPAFDLWVAYVPVDREQKINHSFGLLMMNKPKIPGLVYLFWPLMRYFAESVFTEDRVAVEAEQRAHDEQGGDWNQEVFPAILKLRSILVDHGLPISNQIAPSRRKSA